VALGVRLRRTATAFQYFAFAATTLYVVYLTGLYFFQTSLIYPGVRTSVAAEPPSSPGMEVVHLSSAPGATEALFLPPALPPAGPYPGMIFTHGNGEVVDFWVGSFDGFRERGIGVLLVEYPGYGRSNGVPSESNIRAVLSAAYDRLKTDPRIDASRIFGLGMSLGGGTICLLAKDRPLRALILLSTFPSLSEFAARYWAPVFLLRDRYDNVSALASFAGPVLVIHGREDRLIPWQWGQRLAASVKHATFRLYECGHGCWDPDHNSFWQDADALLESAGIVSTARPGG
jgi:pimeloyl-ACP methyl ester carboxylesterase